MIIIISGKLQNKVTLFLCFRITRTHRKSWPIWKWRSARYFDFRRTCSSPRSSCANPVRSNCKHSRFRLCNTCAGLHSVFQFDPTDRPVSPFQAECRRPSMPPASHGPPGSASIRGGISARPTDQPSATRRCGSAGLTMWQMWQWLVAWHSGRTSVSDWRTFPVLRSTCS